MLKDIFGSLGFVIVGSDILFWAYFFIMDNTCIPFVLINDRKMIDADDPDAPEGVAFIRWLAVQDYLGEKINWKDLT